MTSPSASSDSSQVRKLAGKWNLILLSVYQGLIKHQILEFVFEDPTILDELDHLYKTLDLGKKLLFYFQPEDLTSDGQERQSVAQAAPVGEEAGEKALVLYKDKLRNILNVSKRKSLWDLIQLLRSSSSPMEQSRVFTGMECIFCEQILRSPLEKKHSREIYWQAKQAEIG